MVTLMPEVPDKESIFCNLCKRPTNHVLKGRFVNRWATPDKEIEGEIEYSLWMCAGCETGVLEIKESDSETYNEDDSAVCSIRFFPKRMIQDLIPKRFKQLENRLQSIYNETIESFNAGSLILATAGLRILIEGVCDDKSIHGKNLKIKIDNLIAILPNQKIIDALHYFRDTGNEAVHRLKAPKPQTLKLAISAIEDVLAFLYDLTHKASMLTKKQNGDDGDLE
jgi:hypothetical protein